MPLPEGRLSTCAADNFLPCTGTGGSGADPTATEPKRWRRIAGSQINNNADDLPLEEVEPGKASRSSSGRFLWVLQEERSGAICSRRRGRTSS